jgi:hypothetical protein
MTQKIGEREMALRAMRESEAKQSKPSVNALGAKRTRKPAAGRAASLRKGKL